ncbi:hypothetical protein Hdeb2414_s0009g00322001 [Helianthus debilis subsp. tardiflorus]
MISPNKKSSKRKKCKIRPYRGAVNLCCRHYGSEPGLQLLPSPLCRCHIIVPPGPNHGHYRNAAAAALVTLRLNGALSANWLPEQQLRRPTLPLILLSNSPYLRYACGNETGEEEFHGSLLRPNERGAENGHRKQLRSPVIERGREVGCAVCGCLYVN